MLQYGGGAEGHPQIPVSGGAVVDVDGGRPEGIGPAAVAGREQGVALEREGAV